MDTRHVAALSPSHSTSTFGLPGVEASAELREAVLDTGMLEALETRGVLNWCVGGDVAKMLPLWTGTDGTCLTHAVSLALHGVHDSDLVLRDAVYRTLSGQGSHIFQQRWQAAEDSCKHLAGLSLSEHQRDLEWTTLVARAGQPGKSLEGLHVFVLAQVLSRPIIVYSPQVCRPTCACVF